MNITIKSLNTFEFTSDTCIGYTRKGERFLVDLDKFDLIKDYTWYMNSDGYVRTNVSDESHRQVQLNLHRLIMQCPTGKMVDHVRGKTTRFDNRLCNLRICTNAENQYNRRAINPTGLKGVAYYARVHRYQVQIQINRKLKYLGLFVDRVDAANAYDKAALQFMGEFASLNNIQGPPRPVVIVTEKQQSTQPVRKVSKQRQCIQKHTNKLQQVLKSREHKQHRCSVCGKTCTTSNNICIQCVYKQRSQDFQNRHPDVNRETLKQLIRTTPFTTIATQYGVSDNAIRKWCRKYNLPTKSNEIKHYSDEEWETL